MIPELKVDVELTLGAEKATVSLWKVRHPEWFMQMGVMNETARRQRREVNFML